MGSVAFAFVFVGGGGRGWWSRGWWWWGVGMPSIFDPAGAHLCVHGTATLAHPAGTHVHTHVHVHIPHPPFLLRAVEEEKKAEKGFGVRVS